MFPVRSDFRIRPKSAPRFKLIHFRLETRLPVVALAAVNLSGAEAHDGRMMNTISIGVALYALASGGLAGLAKVITALYQGRATLIRARRGDPESPTRQSALSRVLEKRS